LTVDKHYMFDGLQVNF